MQIIYLLPESQFSINPPSGKAVFRREGETQKRSLELIPSHEIDPNIPYPLLNPLQTLFYHTYEKGNAIVSAPTSAGKSLLSYLFFKKFKGRKAYTAPTKALVYEKAVELRRFYKKVDVRTGDRVVENFKEVSSELVVCTYESLVQAFRNYARWVKELSAVVVDEVHQIKKRWVVEELLAYCLKEGIPILGLSATIPGVEELALWTSSQLLIKSQWRPVPLERFYHSLREFMEVCEEDKVACKLWDALWKLSKPDEKTILFVPQKKAGMETLRNCRQGKGGHL
jgi:helicase